MREPTFPATSIAQAHQLLAAPGSIFEVEERDIRGARIKTWKNAPPSLATIFMMSAAYADRTFLVNDDERVTFDAHRRAVTRLAARLVADGGHKGDHVPNIMRNPPEWPVGIWAASPVGAI